MSSKQAYAILISMMLVSLISTAGIALPYPILAPLFMAEVSSGLTEFAGLPPKLLFAIVLAIYPLGLLIGSSIIGALSDLYGRKKTLLISLVLSAISYLFSAYALVIESYWVFLLSRFITGVFEGNIAIARAIAADLDPIIDKTRAFSWMYAMSYAGWLVGPLAGGYLMLVSTELAFYVAASAVAVSAILVTLFVSETHQGVETTTRHSFIQAVTQHNSFGLLAQAQLRQVFYLYLLLTLGLNAFYEFNSLWLVELFDFTSVQIGHSTAIVTCFMVLTSIFIVERIKRWVGDLPSIYVSLLLLSMLLVLTPLVSETYLPFYLGSIGFLIGLYNTLLPVYFSDRFSHIGQGRLMGLLMSTFCLANIIIALVGGVISLLRSYWPIVLGGILMLAGLIWFISFSYGHAKINASAAVALPNPPAE